MKKLFSQAAGGDYVGKVVRINRFQVTVEEVVAEGTVFRVLHFWHMANLAFEIAINYNFMVLRVYVSLWSY